MRIRMLAVATALFVMCGAAPAVAQQCNLFRPAPGCENAREFSARMDREEETRRLTENARFARDQAERQQYSPICTGDPRSGNMCSFQGYSLGRTGQYAGYGAYGPYYGTGYGGYRRRQVMAEGRYWRFPYDTYEPGYCAANPPPNTIAPKGYEWGCVRHVREEIGAYYLKGSRPGERLAVLVGTLGLIVGAAAVLD